MENQLFLTGTFERAYRVPFVCVTSSLSQDNYRGLDNVAMEIRYFNYILLFADLMFCETLSDRITGMSIFLGDYSKVDFCYCCCF